MRYYLRGETLLIRGAFLAASSGVGGGLADVTTLLNHTVPHGYSADEPERTLSLLRASHGLSDRSFGLMTAVPMRHLVVLRYDFLTFFITAGVTHPTPEGPGTINVIVTSSEGFTPAALLGAFITITEAKVLALRDLGRSFTGTTTDAIIVASEGEAVHSYAGPVSPAGERIMSAVRKGVSVALDRHEGRVPADEPAFFIYSRFNGGAWVEWSKKNCPYYPCHFEGQRCDFCYCPLYPCGDETLGDWVESSSGGKVWACTNCTLNHEPEVVRHLTKNPEASLSELKALRRKK
ncbi:adenosylcobinamide hydrolase [Methanocalculus alkaliphilus]|uniref:adenosylcobinamide amidohydrolase n=1 Tax=Methanocalculus alkaliphilus TaxID=768730 RepID=UPI0020A207A6|nr:adenosylcobinamide amidohydrolase [Methanocalculus alkaliphilus]MCP1715796.1 adenosylcobinamide hydrolase [Methanocalculus alkaliphilus]